MSQPPHTEEGLELVVGAMITNTLSEHKEFFFGEVGFAMGRHFLCFYVEISFQRMHKLPQEQFIYETFHSVPFFCLNIVVVCQQEYVQQNC